MFGRPYNKCYTKVKLVPNKELEKSQNARESTQKAKERSYRQLCGVAKALDLVGERWTLLIVRDLLLGPLRFSELLELEENIGPNLLSRRLRTLVEREWVTVRKEGRARVYALTAAGERLRPVVLALGEFGSVYMKPGSSDGERKRLDWFAFSLQRRIQRIPKPTTVCLVGGDGRFVVKLGPGVEVHRGSGVGIEAHVHGELSGFVRWLAVGQDWRALVDEGVLRIDGSEDAVDCFGGAFT